MKRLEKKDFLLLANKSVENIPDPHNAKDHYQSFIIKKTKISKTIIIITYQSRNFENSEIFDIKSVITEHRKT